MSASRTIIDVPTILDPSSGGKKRRRDEDSEAAEDATDARSMARLISTVLSGPHPAPVAPERQAGGADGSGGTGASVSKDAADKNGEEKSAADKAGLADEKETNDDSTTKPDRKAELRAQIEAAKAENEAIDARRRDIFGAYANLSSVYNYGLSHIAKLNDLSGAPDNTLPGNQPKVTAASGDKEE